MTLIVYFKGLTAEDAEKKRGVPKCFIFVSLCTLHLPMNSEVIFFLKPYARIY